MKKEKSDVKESNMPFYKNFIPKNFHKKIPKMGKKEETVFIDKFFSKMKAVAVSIDSFFSKLKSMTFELLIRKIRKTFQEG